MMTSKNTSTLEIIRPVPCVQQTARRSLASSAPDLIWLKVARERLIFPRHAMRLNANFGNMELRRVTVKLRFCVWCGLQNGIHKFTILGKIVKLNIDNTNSQIRIFAILGKIAISKFLYATWKYEMYITPFISAV